ncbi:MAG: 2-keto-4-pentenoate hydratase [Rhizobiales bacterium]|nr:2-keto-4-pentenoate hydratase [Hyphomicrobiales bacterium]
MSEHTLSPAEQLGLLLAKCADSGRVISVAEIEAGHLLPQNVEQAMRAQAVASAGHPVAGWKVAIGPEGMPVAAPLLDIANAESHNEVRRQNSNPVAVEVEIAFRLGSDIVPGRSYSREDIRRRVDSVHIGVELIGPRLVEGDKAPFPLFLADRLGNGGYVVGPELESGAIDLLMSGSEPLPAMSVCVDGREILNVRPHHPNGDPLAPLVAYANAQIDQLGGLRRGQFVTTGSLCGVLPVSKPQMLCIEWLRKLLVRFG